MRRCTASGFTLVEVIVAVLLLSIMALGLTTTLANAQHARATSERWMRATQLAAQGLEEFRAGQPLRDEDVPTGFRRSGGVRPVAGHSGLYRLEVTVEWDDGEPRKLDLTTLARR